MKGTIMFTRMKRVSVAIVASAVLAGATAGTAWATVIHDFETEKSPAIVTGEGVSGASSFKFHFGTKSTMTCLTNKANGTVKESPTNQLTLEFTHSSCTINEMAATVDSNNCKYVFSGETDPSEHGAMTLECPSGSKLRFTTSGCTFEIAEQKMGGGATYKETSLLNPKDLDFTLTGKELAYTAVGSLCSLLTGNGKDLSIEGIYTMKAYEDNGGVEGGAMNLSMKTTVF
jgi:hypothetical protein